MPLSLVGPDRARAERAGFGDRRAGLGGGAERLLHVLRAVADADLPAVGQEERGHRDRAFGNGGRHRPRWAPT